MKNQRNRKFLNELIKEELYQADAEGIQFMTFNVATEDKTKTAGRIVVAYHFDEKEKDIIMNFAFCSPNDTFDRKYGEFIAVKRLVNSDREIHAESVRKTIRPMLAICLMEEAKRKDVSWMRTVHIRDLR